MILNTKSINSSNAVVDVSEISKRSKFAFLRKNLKFHKASTINANNVNLVLDLFNRCFVDNNYLKPWQWPAPRLLNSQLDSSIEQRPEKTKPLFSRIENLEDLMFLGLCQIGISVRHIQFYSIDATSVENMCEIVGFTDSDLYLDPLAIDSFLSGLNKILHLEGDYEVINEYGRNLLPVVSLKNNGNSLELSSKLNISGYDRMGKQKKLEINIEEDYLTVNHCDGSQSDLKNRDLHKFLIDLSTNFYAHSVTTKLVVKKSTSAGIMSDSKLFYDSVDGFIIHRSKEVEKDELLKIDAVKRSLALSNHISNCLHLGIRLNSASKS